MKRNTPVFLLAAIFLAVFMAAIPSGSVSAQTCVDPKTKKEIPCPPEKKDRPTVVYPSFTPTATTTATHTPSATPAVTSTATATAAPAAAGSASAPPAAGMGCPPYRNAPGVAILLLGAGGVLILGSRIPAASFGIHQVGNSSADRIEAMKAAEEPQAFPAAAAIMSRVVAVIIAILGAIFSAGYSGLAVLSGLVGVRLPDAGNLSPRDPASGLPAMNQPAGPAAAAGAAVGGAGAGLLGAGLLAGILGINCSGAPILLPAGVLAGLLAALIPTLSAWSGATALSETAGRGPKNEEKTHSTFTQLTPVDSEREIRGGSGHKDYDDLE